MQRLAALLPPRRWPERLSYKKGQQEGQPYEDGSKHQHQRQHQHQHLTTADHQGWRVRTRRLRCSGAPPLARRPPLLVLDCSAGSLRVVCGCSAGNGSLFAATFAATCLRPLGCVGAPGRFARWLTDSRQAAGRQRAGATNTPDCSCPSSPLVWRARAAAIPGKPPFSGPSRCGRQSLVRYNRHVLARRRHPFCQGLWQREAPERGATRRTAQPTAGTSETGRRRKR